MKCDIKSFLDAEKPDDYQERLKEEIGALNAKFHMLTAAVNSIGSGFPFSVKDNICVKGVEASASSRILSGYVPPFNATAIERLPKESFAFIGKTKMDEFGLGTFGINCDDHPLNPFDEKRVTGGSSAGSAAATAVIKHHVSIAESTGGSISCPASFCGVVGFTPTYGAVSRYGLIDYANSLDKIGIMSRSAGNIKYVFDLIRGEDPRDSTSVSTEISNRHSKNLIVIDQLMDGIDQRILKSFDRFLSKLQSLGYSIEHRSIPFIEKSIPTYYIISMAEASTNLAKYTGFKYGHKITDFSKGYNDFFSDARDSFGMEAKRRVVLGTFVRSAGLKGRYYEKALRLRSMFIEKLSETLSAGLIISPTMPSLAPKIKDAGSLDPIATYSMDSITIPPNLCGFPHISFPFDYIDGMPVGAQAVSGHFNDYSVIDFAGEWEEQFEYKFNYNAGAL